MHSTYLSSVKTDLLLVKHGMAIVKQLQVYNFIKLHQYQIKYVIQKA